MNATQTRESAVNVVDLTPLIVGYAEAARITCVAERAIREAVYRAELPAFQRGKRVLMRVSDVVEWATRNPYVPSSAA